MNNQVPFFSNTPDDTHCFQAALKMILKFFYPHEEYSWDDLDTLSAKNMDLWTWPTTGLIWMRDKGLDVKVISPFDYDAFIAEGGAFLIRKYGEETGQAQINHSVIDRERIAAKKLLSALTINKSIPTIAEIQSLLTLGYLVVCSLNAQKLNGKSGYVSHFVVIKGFTETELLLHDPGLPPRADRQVSFGDFEKAWAYPNQEAKDLYAFKK